MFPRKVLDVKAKGNSLFVSTSEAHLSFGHVGWVRWCSLLLLVLPLVSCDRDSFMRLAGYDRASLLRKMTPHDDELFARRHAELIRQYKFEEIEGALDPSIKNAEARDKLTAMAAIIPTGEPVSIKAVDVQFFRDADSPTTSITFEYEFAPTVMATSGSTALIPRKWLLVQVVVQKRLGTRVVAGIHVIPISESVEAYNEFTLANKGISQYVALFLAVLIFAFTVFAVVLCIRAKIGKQKWPWLLLMLIDVGSVSVNWTTGHWAFSPLSIRAGIPPSPTYISCTAYGPWVVNLTVPIGAIIFLLCLRRLKSRSAKAVPDEAGITAA